jgi:hypothetical protein
MNVAKAERIITAHQLEGVRLPLVIRDDWPEPWSKYEVAVIMGPAMEEFAREQAAWNATGSRQSCRSAGSASSRISR